MNLNFNFYYFIMCSLKALEQFFRELSLFV